MTTDSLLLNCATGRSALAIYQDGQMSLLQGWGNPRSSGSLLQPALDEMLKRLELRPADIDQVIFAHGPGSFTGLRVGLSFLKGVFFGLEPAYVGVSTLDVMAHSVHAEEAEIYPCLFYRRNEVFSAGYRRKNSIVQRFREPFIMTTEELAELPDRVWLTGQFDELLSPVVSRLDSSRFQLVPTADRELSLEWLYELGTLEIERHGGRELAAAEPGYQVEFKPTVAGSGGAE